jgi:hypothetical protein
MLTRNLHTHAYGCDDKGGGARGLRLRGQRGAPASHSPPAAEVTYLGAKGSASLPLVEVHPHLGPLRPGGLELRPLEPEAIASAADVDFSALPHGVSSRIAPALPEAGCIVIDLAGDFRLPAEPNPGRILQAVGSAGVDIAPSLVDVWIGAPQLVHRGVVPPAYFETDGLRASARRTMSEPEYVIRVRAGYGDGRSKVLGYDLSYDYVRINGECTT